MTLTTGHRVRAQTKEATRRALIQAGLEEAIEQGGVAAPSIEAICARAGYTRGAFYVHFEDRTELVVAMMEQVLTDISSVVFAAVGPGEPDIAGIVNRFAAMVSNSEWPDVANVRAWYLGVMEAVERHPAVRKRHADFMQGVIAQFEKAARTGQQDGEIRADVAPRSIADLAILIAAGAVLWDRIGIPLDLRSLGIAGLRVLASSSASDPSSPQVRTKRRRSQR